PISAEKQLQSLADKPTLTGPKIEIDPTLLDSTMEDAPAPTPESPAEPVDPPLASGLVAPNVAMGYPMPPGYGSPRPLFGGLAPTPASSADHPSQPKPEEQAAPSPAPASGASPDVASDSVGTSSASEATGQPSSAPTAKPSPEPGRRRIALPGVSPFG